MLSNKKGYTGGDGKDLSNFAWCYSLICFKAIKSIYFLMKTISSSQMYKQDQKHSGDVF